ncbi:DUF3017 domain-containing protein [Pseudonocardia kujensis]|uniref:DUF3017 domain-containing protein n=1 Tax=Pseudonocardia kujensis TaxID=1128675 RepID=UPI001E4B2A70|nr:DUF3017 domain-containing protein [Pseudonocardia kujensis]MCE0767140.1 DUF3017 domain-containing protein [Pseudonocardia kujensis]
MSGGEHLRGDLSGGDEPTAPLRRPAPVPPRPGPARVGPLPPHGSASSPGTRPGPPPGPGGSPAPPPAAHGRPGLRSWLEVHGALLLVLLIALGGMAQVLTEHWRQGSALLGGSLLVAALLRGVLPPPRAGLLAIRGRVVDVVCYTGFGIAVLLLALTITRGSLTVG